MKRTIRNSLVLGAWLLFMQAGAADFAASDDMAPDFVLKSTAGPNLRLSEYRGEIVMLTFWASWCGECRGQLQAIDEWHTAYGGSGLQVLAVSLDTKMSQARETAEALGLSYPVLLDAGGDVGELYDVKDVPLTVFVDRDGRVREIVEGYRRSDEDNFMNRLRGLLRE